VIFVFLFLVVVGLFFVSELKSPTQDTSSVAAEKETKCKYKYNKVRARPPVCHFEMKANSPRISNSLFGTCRRNSNFGATGTRTQPKQCTIRSIIIRATPCYYILPPWYCPRLYLTLLVFGFTDCGLYGRFLLWYGGERHISRS
jgi:hypothetical protein